MNQNLLTRIKNLTPLATQETCSVRPITYDPQICIGCNNCVQICQCDILFPSPVKGEHPLVMYPGECYYCGACVMVCPRPGAIRLTHPLMNQARFVPVK
ncbi:MAG: 4Fe-4S dicluster domain-containing protein [Lachnospiraceae bacterium]|nr:4Fe-4S dicluster domain-containing protein [Lachnospiraceae bacterium]